MTGTERNVALDLGAKRSEEREDTCLFSISSAA